MKGTLLLSFLILFFACSDPSSKSNDTSLNNESTIGSNTIEDILRHPANLEGIIDSSDWPKINFDETVIDFDTVFEGEKVLPSFKFVNSGNKSLYILETKVSCGCTITDFNKGEILPGQRSQIDVTFDTQGRNGIQEKSILVVSNGLPNEVSLKIKGFVKN